MDILWRIMRKRDAAGDEEGTVAIAIQLLPYFHARKQAVAETVEDKAITIRVLDNFLTKEELSYEQIENRGADDQHVTCGS